MRTQAVGLADDDLGYDLPLTQSVLADTLGMTTTHLNRSLQELRAKDLIRFGSGHLRILNWDRLRELADFDPAYLNMTCEPR
jgi:CRP-like cAMP-binding protein